MLSRRKNDSLKNQDINGEMVKVSISEQTDNNQHF